MKHSTPVIMHERELARLIERFCAELGAAVPASLPHALPLLVSLATEIADAGSRLGLTRYTTAETVFRRLLLPSLAALKWLPPSSPLLVVDVGCGAGGTGLTLATVCPNWRVTLVDRRKRATAFVDILSARLGLKNVHTLTADAASYTPEERCNAALFRAVAAPHEDLKMASSWVKPGGLALIWTAPTGEVPRPSRWELIGTAHLPEPPICVLVYTRHTGDVENSVDIVECRE
ncbi:MAG: class I SAM-dependent methyltransferase [Armatimonadetes bacterium]|nr:class I SAM-dependent methyltransferase [Armatimonadota bacterium]